MMDKKELTNEKLEQVNGGTGTYECPDNRGYFGNYFNCPNKDTTDACYRCRLLSEIKPSPV